MAPTHVAKERSKERRERIAGPTEVAKGRRRWSLFPRILAPELGVATANTKSVKSII